MATSASSSDTAASMTSALGGLAGARASLTAQWRARDARERRALLLAAAVLGAFVLWSLALAPAWRTVRAAPAQIEALEAQLQTMQRLARDAQTLRAVAPVPLDQAQAALTAAAERLGAQAKLSLQGERALLTLKGVHPDQLNALLAEARAGARAKVVEAQLSQTSPGSYDGSLTLALGGPR